MCLPNSTAILNPLTVITRFLTEPFICNRVWPECDFQSKVWWFSHSTNICWAPAQGQILRRCYTCKSKWSGDSARRQLTQGRGRGLERQDNRQWTQGNCPQVVSAAVTPRTFLQITTLCKNHSPKTKGHEGEKRQEPKKKKKKSTILYMLNGYEIHQHYS